MSYTNIRIRPRDTFTARECGNYDGEDGPITDDTELAIDLGAQDDDCSVLYLTVGKLRELTAAGDALIANIAEHRRQRRERTVYWAERAAARKAEIGPTEAVQS